jgi:hypothetical protein
MGDTSVATVNRHYLKMEPDLMRELVLGGKRLDVYGPSVVAADLSAQSIHAFARSSFRSPASGRREHAMPKRRARDSRTATRWVALRATESACH